MHHGLLDLPAQTALAAEPGLSLQPRQALPLTRAAQRILLRQGPARMMCRDLARYRSLVMRLWKHWKDCRYVLSKPDTYVPAAYRLVCQTSLKQLLLT